MDINKIAQLDRGSMLLLVDKGRKETVSYNLGQWICSKLPGRSWQVAVINFDMISDYHELLKKEKY